MENLEKMKALADKFAANLSYYKDAKNSYNEHSCRVEYIDPLLQLLGWDVANTKGLPPQYREVIAENYSSKTDRPDYSLTLRGVVKLFVEAKKPEVDVFHLPEPALQARKYGWNAKHKVVILTNFEYLVIYDTTVMPRDGESSTVARYRFFHYTEYCEKYDEISGLISRNAVYSGDFDAQINGSGNQKQLVDELFLNQINAWRVALGNELYQKHTKYHSLDILNDVVQEFINQIVFLRICEDKNLPLYHNLKETINDHDKLNEQMEKLFRSADQRYNSGLFSGSNIVFDLSSRVVADIVQGLYYPQSPYLFSIIESNLLGKVYEMFLTEQLIEISTGVIGLAKKKDFTNRSIVTTPTEIVKYMTELALSRICNGKTPRDIVKLRIADIACGSGVFLVSVFEYLQNHCIEWYLDYDPSHLIETDNGFYKLPLEEKKNILCSCIYGIDIDIHAVEVAKFSLLVKLIENETKPSVAGSSPILPDLGTNIFHGNALIGGKELNGRVLTSAELIAVAPFNWSEMNLDSGFDVIIGNPPYVSTEGLHATLPPVEVNIYKTQYSAAYKQFDKYFIFLERAINQVKENGLVCYIIPNKFFKVGAGRNLRQLIAEQKLVVRLDDFGDAQLFEDKTIYSSIVLLKKQPQEEFTYSNVISAQSLWAGENENSIVLKSASLSDSTWKLTTDLDFLALLKKLDGLSVPIVNHADIYNGIQTSAERPNPVYWFPAEIIEREDNEAVVIVRDGQEFSIEKSILKPFFKPTRQGEKGLNSYSVLYTDKQIIFPYDSNGVLISKDRMVAEFSGAYAYLSFYYDRLVPRTVSPKGVRDVPNATPETWYQYGRTQALTSFISTPKLIVGVLSKEPMYAYDDSDMLIASGGTAGYCAISKKASSPYDIEYIQAWLSNPLTEKYIRLSGSDFEGGFIARGTYILSSLPFLELDFSDPSQKEIYDGVVNYTREVYEINRKTMTLMAKSTQSVLLRQKKALIGKIEGLISRVYRLEF